MLLLCNLVPSASSLLLSCSFPILLSFTFSLYFDIINSIDAFGIVRRRQVSNREYGGGCFFLFPIWKVSPVENCNKDVCNNLCDITKRASSFLRLQEWNENVKHDLEEAIYGKRGRAQFKKDGKVDFGEDCDLFDSGRSQLCSFKGRGNQGTGRNGCFADNLFGAFLCTPGSGDARTLCGLGKVGKGAVWSGFAGAGHEKVLFNKVLEKVKEQCTGELPNVLNNDNKLNDLKKPLRRLRDA
ncbi:unnamed protein product [Trypanosoma congolense IL3000]|uniref:WGS project CAEQ00000000 data, annotated contig 1716 n=1 Tax=Trypanosoma congolense (strain IL3000) TaxID=1068625 RepID=F9W883_TRYCI|nr:unnamed protein product [Trypanosoma congolense IL3000]